MPDSRGPDDTARPAERVLAAIAATPWAILPDALDTILAIAARETEGPEAVAARLGRQLDNTHRATMRDGVAIIPVSGPLFRYANVMTALSGATSYATLAQDITTALEDRSVNAILLEVNSPGGMVDGVSELAAMIHAARGSKPIVAHVGGAGASAAYWLASAADRIVASDTAMIGSIGVRMAAVDRSAAEERSGVRRYDFVSSQSPAKADDLRSDEGRARIQRLVDAQAQVFIEAVAKHRGIDAAAVLKTYGQGGVEVGADALAAGMVDAIGGFEATLAELAAEGRRAADQRAYQPFRGTAASTPGVAMSDTTPAAGTPAAPTPTATPAISPDVMAQLRAEGARAESQRIAQIEALALPGHEALLATAKQDPAMTPERFAVAMAQAEKQRRGAGLAAFQGDAAVPMPPPSSAAPGDGTATGQGAQGSPAAIQRGWDAAFASVGVTLAPAPTIRIN